MTRRRLTMTVIALVAAATALVPATTTGAQDGAQALSRCYPGLYGPGFTTTGQCVKDIQEIVNNWGGYKKIAVDGIYGQETWIAVGYFQETYNLEPDYVVGPKTWKVLCHVVDRGTDGPDVDAGCPVG